jgi:predicted ATP-grasp superfamily ATP-dependent carboligase
MPSKNDIPPDFDTATPAVVLKLDHNVVHHGGLGVIRSLGRAGIPVYAVHEHPLAPAAHSRYLHGRFLWTPPQPHRPDQLLAGLVRLAERIGRPSVLIPTDDAGAILLAEHGDSLRRWFRFPAVASDLPRRLAGKYSLATVCQELGLPVVRATLARRQFHAERFAEQVGLPVMVKLAEPWRSRNGAARIRSTTLVRQRRELADLFGQANGAPLMVQEYIPGGPGQDWFFHGYCDEGSRCLPAFTGVKERSYPPHAGLTSLGRYVPNHRLRQQICGMLRRLRYRGIMDLDLRYDARDDRYKLLDFNPRIGAQFRLFTTTDGLDVARAAHLHLTGRPVPGGEPVPDRRFVVENYDSLAALGYLRRGELGVRSWLASLHRVDEAAWFAPDDLAPFGLMCLRTAGRAVSRPLRRGGRAAGTRTAQPVFRPGRASRAAVRHGNGSDPVDRLAAAPTPAGTGKRKTDHTIREA